MERGKKLKKKDSPQNRGGKEPTVNYDVNRKGCHKIWETGMVRGTNSIDINFRDTNLN